MLTPYIPSNFHLFTFDSAVIWVCRKNQIRGRRRKGKARGMICCQERGGGGGKKGGVLV